MLCICFITVNIEAYFTIETNVKAERFPTTQFVRVRYFYPEL